jgi:hypothetical protein
MAAQRLSHWQDFRPEEWGLPPFWLAREGFRTSCRTEFKNPAAHSWHLLIVFWVLSYPFTSKELAAAWLETTRSQTWGQSGTLNSTFNLLWNPLWTCLKAVGYHISHPICIVLLSIVIRFQKCFQPWLLANSSLDLNYILYTLTSNQQDTKESAVRLGSCCWALSEKGVPHPAPLDSRFVKDLKSCQLHQACRVSEALRSGVVGAPQSGSSQVATSGMRLTQC